MLADRPVRGILHAPLPRPRLPEPWDVRPSTQASSLDAKSEHPTEGRKIAVHRGRGRPFLQAGLGVGPDAGSGDVDGAIQAEVAPEVGDAPLAPPERAPLLDLVILEVVDGEVLERDPLLPRSDDLPPTTPPRPPPH